MTITFYFSVRFLETWALKKDLFLFYLIWRKKPNHYKSFPRGHLQKQTAVNVQPEAVMTAVLEKLMNTVIGGGVRPKAPA